MILLMRFPHIFIHKINTKGYNIININVFHCKLMRLTSTKKEQLVPTILRVYN